MMPAGYVLALVLLLAWLPAGADDEERVLLTLQPAGDPSVEMEVLADPGAALADPPVAATRWRLEPGTPIEQAARPPERIVDLYTGTPRALSLVARIVVRYYPGPSGWTAHFQLEQQPAVIYRNGRWQPVPVPGGVGFLVRYGATLPNAEGYFPVLEFGPAGGTLPLVGWQVH